MRNFDFSDERIVCLEVTPCWSGDLPISIVDEALLAQGISRDLLPTQPSRAKSMERAFHECAPRGAKIDPLGKGLGVTMSLKDVEHLDLEMLAKLRGIPVKQAASYNATLTAKILVDSSNGVESETLSFSPEDHPMIPIVKEIYKQKKTLYKTSADLSWWLSQVIIPAVGGVGKRSRGGVYYVPSYNKELILQVARALDSISQSHSYQRTVNGASIPVHRLTLGGKLCIEPRFADDSACMEILIDNVIRETDDVIDDMQAKVDDISKPMGRRAIATKREHCAALEKQVLGWENTCAVSLDLLRNRLLFLQSALGEAEMRLELEDLKL